MQPKRNDPLGATSTPSDNAASANGSSAPSASSAVSGYGEEEAGAAIVYEITKYLRRYVVLTDSQLVALALWVVHTHAIDAAESTPYMAVSSAERESGKTRTQEAIELLVRKPLSTSNISEAALFRSIAEDTPALLWDEVDAIFGPKARDREDLRALLNAGHRRGRVVKRCVGEGAKQRVESFEVFCPKLLAGIGELPETIASRSIPIRMKRKGKDEHVDRFRPRIALALAEPLRLAIAEWVLENVDALAAATPELPDALSDRQQDGWEPLLAIADRAGSDLGYVAREAAVELANDGAQAAVSGTVELLEATRHAFATTDAGRISTKALVQAVAADEESRFVNWWNRDNNEPQKWAARQLAKMLKPYGIKSAQRWIDGENQRGYLRADFEDAWTRYLSPVTHTLEALERSDDAGLHDARLTLEDAGLALNAANAEYEPEPSEADIEWWAERTADAQETHP